MERDESWIGLEPWERVTWARLHWQGKGGGAATRRAAAESLGMKENTYSAYERPPGSSKHTDLDHQRASTFAKKFGVDWKWLLTGEGEPIQVKPKPPSGPKERLLRAVDEAASTDPDFDSKADAIVQLLRGARNR